MTHVRKWPLFSGTSRKNSSSSSSKGDEIGLIGLWDVGLLWIALIRHRFNCRRLAHASGMMMVVVGGGGVIY